MNIYSRFQVYEVQKKEEGRRKKEEGRRKEEVRKLKVTLTGYEHLQEIPSI